MQPRRQKRLPWGPPAGAPSRSASLGTSQRPGPTCRAGRVAPPHPASPHRLFLLRAALQDPEGLGAERRVSGAAAGSPWRAARPDRTTRAARPPRRPLPHLRAFEPPRPGLCRARCVLAPAPTPRTHPWVPSPPASCRHSQWEPAGAGAGGASWVPPGMATEAGRSCGRGCEFRRVAALSRALGSAPAPRRQWERGRAVPTAHPASLPHRPPPAPSPASR